MKRLAKGEGYGNVYFEEVGVPAVSGREILVRTHTSLISRGSEILRRYRRDEVVDPAIMGYSVAGTVAAVGEEAAAAGYAIGDRVFAFGPHADYVVGVFDDPRRRVMRLPPGLSFERATFHALARLALAWARASRAEPTDTVVVLGQGLVGNLTMQALKLRGVGRLIAVESLELRARLSAELGADVVIGPGELDAVAAVRRLTDGTGADVVVDCVGGPPGLRSFQDALEMVKWNGIVQVIGLYHGAPLSLDASKLQSKLIVGGAHPLYEPDEADRERSLALVASGQLRVDPLITHRLPAGRAVEAFALLDRGIDRAMAVLLAWSGVDR